MRRPPLSCVRVATSSFRENALTLRKDTFRNYGIKCEKSRAVQVPRPSAGEVNMLTPADRRTMLEYEVQNQQARRMRHKGEMDEKQLVQLMRCRHPQGCTGVDGLSVRDSRAYAEMGAARDKAAAAAARHAGGRRARLGRVANSTSGKRWNTGVSSLLSHDDAPKPVRETDFLQRKDRGVIYRFSYEGPSSIRFSFRLIKISSKLWLGKRFKISGKHMSKYEQISQKYYRILCPSTNYLQI